MTLMIKLTITVGLPGSGKTTWAREQVNYALDNGLELPIIVCRDDIRQMLFDSRWEGKTTETIAVQIRNTLIRDGLKRNRHVISADTNLSQSTMKELVKIAEFFGAEVEFKYFNTDVNTCIERDSKRNGAAQVGQKVILDMHKRYCLQGLPHYTKDINTVKFEKYEPIIVKPQAIIVDIDGTVASHIGIRSPYDYKNVLLDEPRQNVIDIVERLSYYYHVIFLSGRDASCYDDTFEWLKKHFFFMDYDLFMRPVGDKRQDRIIKGELFNQHIRENYNVKLVLDDRSQVVDLWRQELGIDCFQVNYGDF